MYKQLGSTLPAVLWHVLYRVVMQTDEDGQTDKDEDDGSWVVRDLDAL
jgi:hypothetical protein